MNQDLVGKIVAQALQEIQFARTFKQGKVGNWGLNELMYYNRAIKSVDARSSVQLARMQEFVHTLLSKVDNPLVFKFTKRKNAQTERVALLNALRGIDQKRDHWDLKDIVGKKQAFIYGRCTNNYYADSINGRYRPHLNNVDAYDFLIDPACGGIDYEDAANLGDYGVILNKKQLKDGIKERGFIKSAVNQLIEGPGNLNDMTQEQTNKIARTNDQSTTSRRNVSISGDRFRFWRWYTTYEGVRYYLLMTNSGACIRCEMTADILPVSNDFPQGAWPYWGYAAFPDLTEFWTPSYCDYVREIFMAQDVSINQMLDNAEAINKPQKVVNVTAIENLSELKYRRDGLIKVKGDMDVNKAFQTVAVPSINTPIQVFELLESIQEKASGVSAQAKGVDDTEGKVAIYKGNEEAAADRFGLFNKSYSFGYERFAVLYQGGVRDHLVKKVAIELVGPSGVEIKEVSRRDLFKKNDDYGVMTEASDAQLRASKNEKEAKAAFLVAQANNPNVNKKESFQVQAEIAGFSQEQIDRLMDVSTFGNSKIIAECDRDIEALLEGDEIRPNFAANNAYRQKMLEFMTDHREDMDTETWARFEAYMDAIEDNVTRNEARALEAEQTANMRAQLAQAPPPSAPAPEKNLKMPQFQADQQINPQYT